MPQAYSQCTEPFELPYTMDVESATAPELPNCSYSFYNSFSSQEIFETVSGPVAGYAGNVIAYNTIITQEFTPPQSPVSAALYSPDLQLEQGTSYLISYKYGNSDANMVIDNLYVSLYRDNAPEVNITEHINITGATPATTAIPITVPQSGIYRLTFSVYSQGTQGLLYLDDIKVEEVPTMGLSGKDKSLANIYPNPVKDLLHLNNSSDLDKVTIYNVAGQIVMSMNNSLPLSTVDMSSLAEGIYLAELSAGTGREVIKIVKK